MSNDFDWSTLLGLGAPAQDGDPFFGSLLVSTAAASEPLSVPSLLGSAASDSSSTPESTGESSSNSPVALGLAGVGHKRKSESTAASAHKDLRRAQTSSHSHEEAAEGHRDSKAPISEKRRDQNRAAQRAFRERKEKRVKDLEEKVLQLETNQRERDLENDNLRDLVHQLRRENERLGANQGRFTQSSFGGERPQATMTTLPLEVATSRSTELPAPVSTFPALALSGLGKTFLSELSAPLPPRRASSGGSSSAAGALVRSTSASGSDVAAYEPPFPDVLTPSGQHLNLDSLSASVASPSSYLDVAAAPRQQTDADTNFEEYFVGLNNFASMSPSSSTAPNAPTAASTSLADSTAAEKAPTPSNGSRWSDWCPVRAFKKDTEIDDLCLDMKTKATCQEYARQALEAALQEDRKIMTNMAEGAAVIQ